jgi:predicted Rossmann fold flavoprotein
MPPAPSSTDTVVDIVIVGAGAAGLAAAIFARRRRPSPSVVVLEGARKPGAKILVSGGGRCNVTNGVVTEKDFWGGKATIVRRILRALPVGETVAFFAGLGVPLHEEAGGKLFPDSNRARDVLDALLRGAEDAGATLVCGARVSAIERAADGFLLSTTGGDVRARAVILATGGRSLPKTGSDGAGYQFAAALGHTLVPQTPALAPLVLDPATPHSVHHQLSGVSMEAELCVWIDDALSTRLTGSLLWTHFGVSGPLALNTSRHWARAAADGRRVRVTLNCYPGRHFDDVDRAWITAASTRPGATLRRTLASDVPDAVAVALLGALQLPAERSLADLTREDRRTLVHALTEWPLPIVETRGYTYAEVTAGGVPLTEIDPATMESRVCPGLYLVGEILDADGRIGGFNFQWTWCSAALAGRAVNSATSQLHNARGTPNLQPPELPR